jgi:hypothetical protein
VLERIAFNQPLSLRKFGARVVSIIFLALAPNFSWAYVECTLVPTQIYVDDGVLWINFSNGGAGVAPLSDPAMKYYYASALTAYTAGKTLIVRYPDGNACTAFNIAMIGLWIK